MLELNKLYNLDCIDGMEQLDNNSVDLTVTSPPYDNLRSYDGFEFDYKKTIDSLYRVTKDGGVVVWVVGDSTQNGTESGTSFKQALYFKEIGFNLHDTMIYHKANYIPLTHNRYEQCFEYMFVFSKGKPKTFNPIMVPCEYAGKVEKTGTRGRMLDPKQASRQTGETIYRRTNNEKIHPNIFTYACGQSRSGHPAPFPDDLAKDMISSWSNENDLVLDPFMGSGTTAIQAMKLKRNWVGFEISDKYTELANSRIDLVEKDLKRRLFW